VAGLHGDTHDHVVRLAVHDELDTTTAARFTAAGRQALTGRRGTTLALDLRHVTFIDAAGIGALVTIRNHAVRADNVVVVTQPSRCVLRLLEVTGLAATFVAGHPIG
jgi:anti-sigma B factor antagonist